MTKLRLGVNVDHVATLRNARGGEQPCPVRAALACAKAGAHGITAHLREDRRHIRDQDISRLRTEVDLPLNLEMAATDEMLAIALAIRPHAVCLVPEKREELTTEGGLNVAAQQAHLAPYIAQLSHAGIRTSLFIDADVAQIEAAAACGAPVIELHTGTYAQMTADRERLTETTLSSVIRPLSSAAQHAASLGLEVHAGHGLTFDNVAPVAAIPQLAELNIGHFLIGEAIFSGLENAVRMMLKLMHEARA